MSENKNTGAIDRFSLNRDEIILGLKEYLSWSSISTDPAFKESCEGCVKWLHSYLTRIGFVSEIINTGSFPLLFARWTPPGQGSSTSKRKRVLYYGHYDVQPVDPVSLWLSPPFEPEIRDGRIYARGAMDNKGQTWYFIKAVEDLIKRGALEHELILLIEGEEESGSEGILRTLPQLADRLRADTLLVCDTSCVHPEIGTIVAGMRGLVGCSFVVSSAKKDLHSGNHGGVAPNPLIGISRLIASLYNPDGSVAIKGFYDGVPDPTAEELALLARNPFDEAEYIEEIGVAPLGGEVHLDPNMRVGFRPTLEINGINGGYGGPGAKTVIPASVSGKLTSRIVSGQDPERVLEAIKAQMRRNLPDGFMISFSEESTTGGALKASIHNRSIDLAREILQEMFGKEPICSWFGASIPVIASLVQVSKADPILVGFGLEEDNMHAPNESFALKQLEKGFNFIQLYLQRL